MLYKLHQLFYNSVNYVGKFSMPVALCAGISMLPIVNGYATHTFGLIESIPFVGGYAAGAIETFGYIATVGGYFTAGSVLSAIGTAFVGHYVLRASADSLRRSEYYLYYNNDKTLPIILAISIMCGMLGYIMADAWNFGYSTCVGTAIILGHVASFIMSAGKFDNFCGMELKFKIASYLIELLLKQLLQSLYILLEIYLACNE